MLLCVTVITAVENAPQDSITSGVSTQKAIAQVYVDKTKTLIVTNESFIGSNFNIYELNGTKVLSGKLKSNSFNLNKLHNGFYIVQFNKYHSIIQLN